MNLEHTMFATILFLCVSIFFVTISSWLRLGSIVGFLVAGVALGPHSPGLRLTSHTDELLSFGELGVVFLMFTIGLEMRPSKLWAMRRMLFGLGPAQILVTGAAIAASLLLTTKLSLNGAIIIGVGLAMSSTAIVMQIMGEKGEVTSDHGKASFAVLVMQDFASVLLLIAVPFVSVAAAPTPAIATPWWEQVALVVAAVGGVLVFGRYALPLLFTWTARRQSTGMLGVIVLIAVMAAGLAMDEVGLSMAMGAFVLGVMLSASDFRYQVEASILPLKGIFMALFFVGVGMSIDIDVAVSAGSILFVLVFQVIAIKIAVMVLLGLVFGLGAAGALRSAFLLSPCSEFGFVVFAAAKTGGLLNDHGFAIAVVVVSLSMALTPFVVNLGYWLADRLAGKPKVEASLKEISEGMENHVVVAGCARPGRLMCIMLEKTDSPYIAFDLDLGHITRAKAEGLNVHYGDVSDPEMQGAAAFAKAKSVVVTLEDMEAAKRLVEHIQTFYPHLPIQLAAPDLPTQDAMRAIGVKDAICTGIEGNLQLAGTMLRTVGVPKEDIDELIETLRKGDYAMIRGGWKVQHETNR